MTAIAQALDEKLKQWRPETASRVEKLVTEIIHLADAETQPAPIPSGSLATNPRERSAVQ